MAEELESGGVCGGNWWLNSPRSLFLSGVLPCSSSSVFDFDAKMMKSHPFFDDFWDRELLHGDGKTIGDYQEGVGSGMKSEFDYAVYADSFESPFGSSSSSSLLESFFDGQDSSYNMMVNQDEYFRNLGVLDSAPIPEKESQFGDFPTTLMPSEQPHFVNSSSENRKLIAKKHGDEADAKPPCKKSSGTDPQSKRQRIETPSPLPTFKVRKEKLGDRVTALQQLVSPFGKTDTASVLHEAIEYIKFLHDKVDVLSSPYFKTAKSSSDQLQQKTQDGLRSRGLCLMPVSVTYPVATETAAGFWTPSFERSFG